MATDIVDGTLFGSNTTRVEEATTGSLLAGPILYPGKYYTFVACLEARTVARQSEMSHGSDWGRTVLSDFFFYDESEETEANPWWALAPGVRGLLTHGLRILLTTTN